MLMKSHKFVGACFAVIFLVVSPIPLSSTMLQTSGQSTVGSTNVDHKTRQQLEQTAQRFVKAYRKRRDFKDCFEAFFVRDAVDRMKLSGFFKAMDLDPALIQHATTEELAHAYVAIMNYHFASLAYEFNYPKAPVPRELTSHKKNYRYLLSVIDDSGLTVAVVTKEDLARFTREFEYAADVYRRLLPRDAFNSRPYKSRIAQIGDAGRLDKLDGLPDFGIPEGTPVFAYTKDMFNFYFVNVQGHYRVVTLGLD
ncbi:MAG TPA: hypothetical protein VHS05_10815 [Pyrinomonadaceae bacterium]|nr:hypothetical protein [Pyrinomonadaceae bacterium]